MSILKDIQAWFAETPAKSDLPDERPQLSMAYSTLQSKYSNYLPLPDKVVKKVAPSEHVGLWSRVLRQEGYVSGLLDIRVTAAVALPWEWHAGDESDPTSVRLREEIAAAWNWYSGNVTSTMMHNVERSGIALGYAVVETYDWGPVELSIVMTEESTDEDGNTVEREIRERRSLMIPRKMANRDSELFRFDGEDNLLYIGRGWYGAQREPVEPFRAFSVAFGSGDTPYGRSDLMPLYNDLYELNEVRKLGLEALERAGYPPIVVLLPDSMDDATFQTEVSKWQAAYKNVIVKKDAVDRLEIITPEGNATPTFIGAEQNERIRMLHASLSMGLLGMVITEGQVGSFAKEKVGDDRRYDKTAGVDAHLRDAAINSWRDLVMQANYPEIPRDLWPEAISDSEPTEDTTAWSELALKWKQEGFPLDIAQVSEKLGLVMDESADGWAEPTQTNTDPFGGGEIDENGVLSLLTEQGSTLQIKLNEDQVRTFREA